jgi:hypothetical protein
MYHYTTDGKHMNGACYSKFSKFKGGKSDADTTENYTPGESSPWTTGVICAIVLAIIVLIISIICFYNTKRGLGFFLLIISILCGSAAYIFYRRANKNNLDKK